MKSKQLVEEISKLSVAELKEKKRALHEELFKLRCKKALSQLDRPAILRSIKRDIARVNTILTTNSRQ